MSLAESHAGGDGGDERDSGEDGGNNGTAVGAHVGLGKVTVGKVIAAARGKWVVDGADIRDAARWKEMPSLADTLD
jgi:hypothetical protein